MTSRLSGLSRFARRKPLGALGGAVMVAIVLAAVFAGVIARQDPIATEAGGTLARPSAAHWLGTDHLGRDIYSRVVHGARISLVVGLASTLLGSGLGGRCRRHYHLRIWPHCQNWFEMDLRRKTGSVSFGVDSEAGRDLNLG